jgi:hypothetical protein
MAARGTAPRGRRRDRRSRAVETINNGESRDDCFGRAKDEQLGHRYGYHALVRAGQRWCTGGRCDSGGDLAAATALLLAHTTAGA